MREHGASASTFSDWWAYKFEVYDAIPYNAALLQMNGVNTGINSDDAEMSRRLNQEAAKAVKYGGVSAEEAWKMVTLNPARMLGLDHRIGDDESGLGSRAGPQLQRNLHARRSGKIARSLASRR